MHRDVTSDLFEPLHLPCGAVLKNRLAKSAMSDSLGDGAGNPTDAQIRLYMRWAMGGVGLSIIGEVQGDPSAAEKPGNLVLGGDSDIGRFRALADAGRAQEAHLWLQLGHAGAMTHPPIGTPRGPSALDLPGLRCAELSAAEIAALPQQFAQTARQAMALGFGGVQIHAAHGFLLSQFLSPLFNKREDAYGGDLMNRARLLFETIDAVRAAVGPGFPVGLKINATDQLSGGFSNEEALAVIAALDQTSLDLIDISGGTYFPGAPSASDGAGRGPYFLDFAERVRGVTDKPLMVTGGFKTAEQALDARARGIDVVGLARALVLEPELPARWQSGNLTAPAFPRFTDPPEGGVTAWYTMRLTDIGEGQPERGPEALRDAIAAYDARDKARVPVWNARFPRKD